MWVQGGDTTLRGARAAAAIGCLRIRCAGCRHMQGWCGARRNGLHAAWRLAGGPICAVPLPSSGTCLESCSAIVQGMCCVVSSVAARSFMATSAVLRVVVAKWSLECLLGDLRCEVVAPCLHSTHLVRAAGCRYAHQHCAAAPLTVRQPTLG
jgi:hypothetical protein